MQVGTAMPGEITSLLHAWNQGDTGARSHLFDLVYRELRVIAGRVMAKECGQTLEPTALVHEAYLRLVGQKRMSWRNRTHLFSMSATIMRRILVDHARRRQVRARRDKTSELQQTMIDAGSLSGVDTLALDRALEGLAHLDATKARVVELRYFGGLTVPETAEVLKLSAATINRHWRLARAWLFGQLRGQTHDDA